MLQNVANPEAFERLASKLRAPLALAATVAAAAGIYLALFASPADYQQGESVRIMYVHVPAAWMALLCYSAIAVFSALGFILKLPLADVAAKASAPPGAVFAALALVTGSLWGKPMWGTYWAWDARLTSMLILLFLYLGYIAVWETIEDKARAARLAAVVALVGAVNVPIVKFSVDWWSSLHQPASVIRAGGPSIHASMLAPLLVMAGAYLLAYLALLVAGMGNELLARRLHRLEGARRPVSRLLEAPETGAERTA
jgi:heme exporter protein C